MHMASPSTTLYRFRIDLSDITRGVYEQLDFRIAQHPSETDLYLLTRMLAFCLNWQEGLEFSSTGLSDPEGPCIFLNHVNGRTLLWIEIGNPQVRKIHRASKASDLVKIYTYKNPELILKESAGQNIHRAQEIEIQALDPQFLERLSRRLTKEVRWSVLFNDGVLTVGAGDVNEQTEVRRYQIN